MSPHRCAALAASLSLVAAVAHAQGAYQREIQAWIKQSQLNPPAADSVVFVGSSSIRRWETLLADFAHYDPLQRGFGGSQFSDLIPVVGQIVVPYDPAAVVVFEGTNDVASGKSAATVFNDYLAFVDAVHQGQNQSRPPLPILFLGITPTPARWSLWPIASQVNSMVEAHAQTDPSLFYVDIPSAFLATGSPPNATLFVADGLHLSPSGYALWTSVIRPAVEAAVPSHKVAFANPHAPLAGARVLVDFGPSDPTNGHHTVSPDAFGQFWNNWHEVQGGLDILAGQSLGDLVDTSGAHTGVDLVIAGGFASNGLQNGGLVSPSAALLGTLAVATATQDYVYSDDLDEPGGVMLSGLDPALSYDLRLFASRNATETRVTRYRVRGACGATETVLQTSGVGSGTQVGYNGNQEHVAELVGLVPDRFGQLFLDQQVAAGSLAYLGIMELTARAPGQCLGGGCGADPVLAPILTTGAAVLGQVWPWQASHFAPGVAGVALLSAGRPSPRSLGLCTTFIDTSDPNNLVAIAVGAFDAGGRWNSTVALPAAPGFAGLELTGQVVAANPALASGFELSNGWRATLLP